MRLTLIQLSAFVAKWSKLKLSDEDLQSLEGALIADPQAGDPIPGTGGLRKLRFAPPSRHTGKRGAFRVIYAFIVPGDAVYLIVKGSVTVFTGGMGDRPERILNELGAGACIGEMAVLDAAPRSATVRANIQTRMLRVPGEGFKRVMSERPEMSQAIVAELVKRMRGMMAQAPSPSMSNPSIPIPPVEE